MRILIVEDDRNVRDGLSVSLDSMGYTVHSAASYRDALDALSSFSPDVVLCDWQLDDPDGDGVGVAQVALASGVHRIVMMTARELSVLKRVTHHLDIAAYLRKPVALEQLVRSLVPG